MNESSTPGLPESRTVKEEPAMKLEIELIPRPLWAINTHTLMPQSQWDQIRRQAYTDCGHQCSICGGKGKLEPHTRWEYNDANLVQRLLGFMPLCLQCHGIKHLGRSEITCTPEQMKNLVIHFMTVNQYTREEFEEHEEKAFAEFERRSRHKNWKRDWGQYQYLTFNLIDNPQE